MRVWLPAQDLRFDDVFKGSEACEQPLQFDPRGSLPFLVFSLQHQATSRITNTAGKVRKDISPDSRPLECFST